MTNIIVIFYVLLFVGLLLGDGKQSVIEIFGSSVILVCWAYYRLQQKQFHLPSSRLFVPWAALFLVAALSFVFSDSRGLSLSWIIRLVNGYLAYVLFYNLASRDTLRVFFRAALIFVFGAVGLFGISLVVPSFHSLLPSMNLIDVRYGHNHLADLLIFVLPLAVYKARRISFVVVRVGLFLGYSFLLLSTLARGAWIVAGAYASAVSKNKIITVTFFVFFVLLWFVSGNDWFSSYRLFRPMTTGARLEYWRQALVSVAERPVFGSGPGTFSLTSIRLQQSPGHGSWFAHSLLFQTASEMGLAGVAALIWLFAAHGALFVRKRTLFQGGPQRALLSGLLLVFLYSMFEFVLDYKVTWVLFWAGLGILAGLESDGSQIKTSKIGVAAPLAVVCLYYTLWMGSSLALLLGKPAAAFLIAPFDATNALLTIKSIPSARPEYIALALFFHKKNPEILFAASNAAPAYDPARAFSLRTRAIEGNRHNDEYWKGIPNLLEFSSVSDRKKLMMIYTQQSTEPTDKEISELLTNLGGTIIFSVPHNNTARMRIFYSFGLSSLETNPDRTMMWWALARDSSPKWSYIHIELASLAHHVLSRPDLVASYLEQCLKIPLARRHCAAFSKDSLPPPGSFAEQTKGIIQ